MVGGAATGPVVLDCSSNANVASPGILPSSSWLRRRKPYSKRTGFCSASSMAFSAKAFHKSVLKCPAWNQQGPVSKWTLVTSKAVATTLEENWVASEEATALAAAEEAMALARAAVLAAREAVEANTEDVSSYSDLLSMQSEMLLTHAANSRATTASRGGKDVLQNDQQESEFTTVAASSFELLASLPEITSDQELVSERLREEETDKVDVAVKSKRRQERMLKRTQLAEARKKAQELELEKSEGGSSGLFSSGGPRVTASRDRYCPQMSRRIRMTAAEELEAINGIQDHTKMNAVKTSMSEQLGREPTFREWADALTMDPRDLHKKLFHIKRCRNIMVSSNLGLVIKVARKFAMKGTNIEDLIQEGINGLLHGVEKFDTTRGFRLSTYVLWWIELSVRRASVKRSILCQVPMHLFDMHTRVLRTRARIFEERGSFPTNEEVSKILGTSPHKVHMVANLMRPPRSLDDNVPGCDNVTLTEILPDPNVESPFLIAERLLLQQQLDKVLNMLKPREKEVLCLRYGIGDGRERTLEELSHYFDLSRERVRQIEKRALSKIAELGGKELLASFVQTFITMTEL